MDAADKAASEFGEITWYPENGPIVTVPRPPDPEDPDRKASTEEQRMLMLSGPAPDIASCRKIQAS